MEIIIVPRYYINRPTVCQPYCIPKEKVIWICFIISVCHFFNFWKNLSLCLVFCCYQQLYDILNMSYLAVILQVRGCDGMSTPQNDAAAYLTVSRITYLPWWFPVAFPAIFVYGKVLPNCRGFPPTSLSLASSQLLMQTAHVWPAKRYQVTRT